MVNSATVLTRFADGVLCLTLNRPDTLNALNEDMHLALRQALERARDEENIRAVLLTGSGRAFCAGQDLRNRSGSVGTRDLGYSLEVFYNPLMRLIRSLEKPIVCAVNGVAAGAGANIALGCDIALAARSARFIQAFSRIGLIPDAGGTWFLPRLIGEARAKGLALTGEPVSAETAADWGLIWRVVDDDALLQEAETLARHLAAGPTKSLGLAKSAIQAAAFNSLDQQLDLERDLQRAAGYTADYAEGVAAFLEKRAPAFKGR